MSKFGLPTKVIRLFRTPLITNISSLKVGKDLPKPFDTRRVFRQGDSISWVFFNTVLEKVICAAVALSTLKVQCYWGTHDNDIVGLNNRAASAALPSLKIKAK